MNRHTDQWKKTNKLYVYTHQVWPTDFMLWSKSRSKEGLVFSTNDVKTIGYPYSEEREGKNKQTNKH